MSVDPLLTRARGLWEALAAVSVSFAPAGGLTVVASPESLLCPPSWVGIVVLGDAAIVTAPTDSAAHTLSRAMASVPTRSLTSAEAVRTVLPVTEVLGPATLGYLSRDDFRPARADRAIGQVAPGHRDLLALTESAGPEDAGESGMEEITSPAFVVREGADVAAAAGYRIWPASTAHVSVLTSPRYRGADWAGRWPPRRWRTHWGRTCCLSGGPGRRHPVGSRPHWASGNWGRS